MSVFVGNHEIVGRVYPLRQEFEVTTSLVDQEVLVTNLAYACELLIGDECADLRRALAKHFFGNDTPVRLLPDSDPA